MEIYEVFNLDIPHGNFSAHYDMQNKYLDIMHDKTSAVEISEDQFQNMPKGQQTILYIKHTTSTTQSTHQLVYQLCMPRTRTASRKDVPYRLGKPTA